MERTDPSPTPKEKNFSRFCSTFFGVRDFLLIHSLVGLLIYYALLMIIFGKLLDYKWYWQTDIFYMVFF